MKNFFVLSLFLSLFFVNARAAQIQPVEVVESKPITSFTDETSAWPTQSYESEIIKLHQQSAFETLGIVPGVDVRGSLSKGSPGVFIRGNNSATRTLLMYDGIPLNLGDGVGASELLLPREAVGQVHLLKGPSSVYFGSHAMGGALNFSPEFYTRHRIRGAVGSFGQRSAFGAASLQNDDRNQIVATAFAETISGDYKYFSPPGALSGTRDRNDTHTQRFTLSGNHVVSGYKIGYRALYATEQGSTPSAVNYIDPIKNRKQAQLYALKASKDFDTKWRASAQTSFVETQSANLTESTNSIYTSRVTQNHHQAKLVYTENNNFVLGGFFSLKTDELRTSGSLWEIKRDQELDPGILIEFPFSEDTWLQSGARYLPKYGVAIKSVGAIKQDNDKKFWLTYSEGFRPPSLSDKFDTFGAFQGNPNLKPEESDQIELGASHEGLKTSREFFNRLSYELSVYTANYENLITYNDNSTTKINKNFSRSIGGELDLSYPLELWGFGLGYSYVDASAENRPLPFTYEQKLIATVVHYFGPLVFEIKNHSTFNYRRTTRPDDKTSWNLTDFYIRTNGLTDWNISGGITNLLDHPIEYMENYPEPGRRVFVSVERLF